VLKFLNRILQILASLIALTLTVYIGLSKSQTSLLLVFLPFLSLISRSRIRRLIFTAATLSALTPYLVAETTYAIPLIFLLLISLDIDLRKIEKIYPRPLGPGSIVIFSSLALQLAVYQVVPSGIYVIYSTLAYALLVFLYEFIRILRVDIDKPEIIYCSMGDLINLEIKIGKAKGLFIKILREKYRIRRRDGEVRVWVREYISNIGRKTIEIPLLTSGSRKFLVFRKKVKIRVEARPKLEKALVEAHRLALQILPRHGEPGELYEAGAKTGYGGKGFLYSLRPYMPGDDLRSINFKKSLSRGELVVNEYLTSGVVVRKGVRVITRVEGYATIIVLADLSSNSLEELDDLAYKTLSLIMDLIEANLTPRAVMLIQGDKVIYRAVDLKAKTLLEDLIEVFSKVSKSKYKPYSLEEPILDFSTPAMLIEYSFIKQASENSIIFNILTQLVGKVKPPATFIIIRPASRKPGVYSFVKNALTKMDYEVIEYKI